MMVMRVALPLACLPPVLVVSCLPYRVTVYNLVFCYACLLMHTFLHVGGPSDDLRQSEKGLQFSPLACGSSRSTPGSLSDGDGACCCPAPWAQPPPAPGDSSSACRGSAAHRPPASVAYVAGVVRNAREPSRLSCHQLTAARLRRRCHRLRVSCGRGPLARQGRLARAAAHLHGLHLRLDCKEGTGACVENPRRQRPHLARGQGPVPDQPPDHWRAHPQLLCGCLDGQPLLALSDMGETRRRAPAGPAVNSPRLACRSAIAQAMQRCRDRLVLTDLGECADQLQDLGSGHVARLTYTMAGDAELRMHAAVPVERQAMLRGLLRGVDHALLEDRADKPLFAL